MKTLFLSASFAEVSDIFRDIFWAELRGKTLTFIPTASLTEEVNFYIDAAKKAFANMWIHIDELEISTATPEEIKETIQKNDGIYISWWNTFFLLQELQNSWADKIIIDEVFNWKIYIWESAGSMIAWKNIEYAKEMDDASVAKNLISQEALWLVDFALVPHFGNFPFEKATKNIIEKYSGILDLKPISNSEAIVVSDETVQMLQK